MLILTSSPCQDHNMSCRNVCALKILNVLQCLVEMFSVANIMLWRPCKSSISNMCNTHTLICRTCCRKIDPDGVCPLQIILDFARALQIAEQTTVRTYW